MHYGRLPYGFDDQLPWFMTPNGHFFSISLAEIRGIPEKQHAHILIVAPLMGTRPMARVVVSLPVALLACKKDMAAVSQTPANNSLTLIVLPLMQSVVGYNTNATHKDHTYSNPATSQFGDNAHESFILADGCRQSPL
jgi:hypothetical protein